MALTNYEKAMLDTIAYAEGTMNWGHNGYDITLGHKQILGWTENTDIRHRCVGTTKYLTKEIIEQKGGKPCTEYKNGPFYKGEDKTWFTEATSDNSIAVGRYQFLGSTWATACEKVGLEFNAPLTKQNQDLVGAYLMNKKVNNTDLVNGYKSLTEFKKTIGKLKGTWESFKRALNNNYSITTKQMYDVYVYAYKAYKNGIQSGSYSGNKKGKSNIIDSNKVIFVGGLDNRSGDQSLQQQTNLLKQGLGSGISVSEFRYNNLSGALNEIESTPNTYVVLFSAGAEQSKKVAEKIISVKGSLGGLYIVEFYGGKNGTQSNTASRVKGAVALGVPPSNVYEGNSLSTGKDVVNGATSSNCSSPVGAHWCALKVIGQKIKSVKQSFTT
jgi:muramidase (phage lysozyme)